MQQNLIVLAGLSHSGKDLLFSQLLKLGGAEPGLRIRENLIYYDWLNRSFKEEEESYFAKVLPALKEKLYLKINTLIYVHDISYQVLDDIANDFKDVYYDLSKVNKDFQVILIINRGHLIPNEQERTKMQKNVENHLQQLIPQEITSYIVSLKGSDQQRMTNLAFTQIVNKAVDFTKNLKNSQKLQVKKANDKQLKKIEKILKGKMEEFGFSGAYLIGHNQDILIAIGKSEGWEKNVGPQIIRMLAQFHVFDLGPQFRADIIRIEDFVMITKRINADNKIILVGRESVFKYEKEPYPRIEESCFDITTEILEILK
ncbi:MAG: hypothetical protein ACW98F_09825 [Candidatus Hodarchaeales archaeon]